jgi:hypothetical protein
MKKLKTVLILIFSIVAISILVYFLPTENLFTKLPFSERFYRNTTLEIVTINGKAKVTIDGKDYGETPVNINELTPGDYNITLERISDAENFYQTETFNVKLTKNTTSRIEVEIGPAGIIHGAVLYYTEQNSLDKENGLLTILSDIEGSKIYLDGEYLKEVPVVAQTLSSKEYDLEVNAEGYENLEIPILIEEGYLLNVKTYLFPIPIIFDRSDNA